MKLLAVWIHHKDAFFGGVPDDFFRGINRDETNSGNHDQLRTCQGKGWCYIRSCSELVPLKPG